MKFNSAFFLWVGIAMFIGRIKEKEILFNNLNNISTVTMVYGKKRVGKTTLIKYVLEQSN